MEPPTDPHHAPVAPPRRSALLFAAFGAFAVANLIHNDFGLDPAIVPAALLAGTYWWRPKRALLWGTALVIALPAFGFFNWRVLTEPPGTLPFLNHVALLAAGALAAASILRSFVPAPARPQHA